jgi:hypothetical protein
MSVFQFQYTSYTATSKSIAVFNLTSQRQFTLNYHFHDDLAIGKEVKHDFDHIFSISFSNLEICQAMPTVIRLNQFLGASSIVTKQFI